MPSSPGRPVHKAHYAVANAPRRTVPVESGLVEESALSNAGLVLGRHRDVVRAEQENLGGHAFNPPVQSKVSPAAKSTKRLASESSISDRFMMTGVPDRKCSPIVRASL